MLEIDVDRMSPEDRLALIGRLWDSLADTDIPLTSAQQAELERRLARFEEERASNVAWDDLRAELLRRSR
jgi:putative addiction module component (TIGR02574 family)